VWGKPPELDYGLTEPIPRLIRFVDELPRGVAAQLDKDHNLLLVSRAVYDTLGPQSQGRVLKARNSVVMTKDVDYAE